MTDLAKLIADLEAASEHGEEIGEWKCPVCSSVWWNNRHRIIAALRALEAEKEAGGG